MSYYVSMQYMNSSLDKWVKILSKIDFNFLYQEFFREMLELIKRKGFYAYKYIDSFVTEN